MERTKLIFILFVGLFLAIGIIFLILYRFKNRIVEKTETLSEEQELPAKVTVPMVESYRFADAFDTIDLLGKSAAKTGVNEKYFTERIGYQVLEFDTTLFGKEAYGSVYFSGEDNGSGKTVDTVYLYSSAWNFAACKEQMIKQIGGPVSEWEIPYVEVNGGAQSGAEFTNDGVQIKLLQGSERKYIEIEIRKISVSKK